MFQHIKCNKKLESPSPMSRFFVGHDHTFFLPHISSTRKWPVKDKKVPLMHIFYVHKLSEHKTYRLCERRKRSAKVSKKLAYKKLPTQPSQYSHWVGWIRKLQPNYGLMKRRRCHVEQTKIELFSFLFVHQIFSTKKEPPPGSHLTEACRTTIMNLSVNPSKL